MKSKVKITSAIIAIILAMAISPIYAQWGFKVGEENKMPSADTWNFIKYGEVGASLHTGTVNLSIPVYTYRDNDFTIPVSLNYSSNGYMANMRPGILGPDWVLDAGGKISVEIRGMHDLKATGYAKSYYQFHQLETPGTEGSYWRYSNFADQNVELGAPAPEIIYIPEQGANIHNNTPRYDAEPDFFHFNFMGYSGSFHLGPNNTIYVYNTNGDNKLHKIELVKKENNVDIIITDKNGYKYEFPYSDGEMAMDRSGEPKLRVSYNLTKIFAPNGREVRFYYDMYDMTTYRPATFANTGAVIDWTDNNNPVGNSTHYNDHRILESALNARILTSISVDNKSIIEFAYKEHTSTDEYVENIMPSSNQAICKMLESIKVLNPYDSANTIIMKADFTYQNTDNPLVHFLSSVTIGGEGTYSFEYKDIPSSSLPLLGTYSADHWGYYNGKTASGFLKIVSTNSSTLDETITSTTRNPDASYAIKGMLQKITYPTGGYSQLEYEPHSYGKAFRRNSGNSFIPTLVNETGVCGGLRIKSVSNHLADGTQASKKTYSYTNPDGSSSGILLYFPKYWLTYSATVESGAYNETNINYWSNNLISHNGSHIEYSTVTQTNSDNSREVFHFSNSAISSKYRDALETGDIVNEIDPGNGQWGITSNPLIRNIVAPLLSKKAERGKLLKHQIYAAGEQAPVKEITYTYDTTRTLSTDTYPVYLIRRFGHVPVYTDNWRLVSKTETENNGTASITRTETYTYNALGQLSSTTVTSSSGTQETTRYTYPYDHSAEGGIYTTMLSRNLHGYPVSESRYIKENGVESLIGGKKYNYTLVNGLVKPASLLSYNTQTQNWENEHRYTAYDSLGNLLESYNAVNVPTSYIWGYGGMYLVGKVENSTRGELPSAITATPLEGELPQQTATELRNTTNRLLTTFQYNPFIGLSKVTHPNGTTESYTYNSTGKLAVIYDHMGRKKTTNYYSPDNRQ